MNDATLLHLRHQLVARYDEIKRQLMRRLGSDELAGEVLQETYLHLNRQAKVGTVRNPLHYLVAVATNIARMRLRREKSWVSLDEVDEAVGLVDEAPDPARSAEGRLELEALQRAFDALTPRRRHILFAARVEGQSLREIAAQLDLSQRLIEMELKHALDHCALKLDRSRSTRFGFREQEVSKIRRAESSGESDGVGLGGSVGDDLE